MRKILTLILALAACVGMSWAQSSFTDIEIDLRDGQLGTSGSNLQKYLTISGSTYTYTDDEPATYNALLTANSFNGSQHGYVSLVANVPVVAGNYKITLGACGYGNGAGSVKNADGSVTYKTFNQQIVANDKCYHQNTTENIVSVVVNIAEAQTIKVICGNYTPYIKIEKLAALEYTVTFAAAGAEGTVPAAVNVVDGESLTIPTNKTLYKEGYTLTGWNDGVSTYAIGDSFTPTADATLNAVFTANEVDLLNASTDVTVRWYFGESNGAPSMSLQGNGGTGILVAQATIGLNTVDVKLDINATSGKFHNSGRGDKWAQVNSGTIFTFPGEAGATVAIEAYSSPSYSTTQTTLTANDNNYYSYLEVTYPANGYYIVGTMNSWTPAAAYMLEVNPANPSEYMFLDLPLSATSEFKVVYSADGTAITTWYPDMTDNYGHNGEIPADGTYDIYFSPSFSGGDDWFYNCIYVIANVTLLDEDPNSTTISAYSGRKSNVLLDGRTLYKDGSWNTLCLPFALNADQVTAMLAPSALMTLGSTSLDGNTLTMTFVDATTIVAGKPYIIKWEAAAENLVEPEFSGVTISDALVNVETTYADFKGNYNPVVYDTENKGVLFLGADNTFYYPDGLNPTTVNALRGYFELKGIEAGTPAQGAPALRIVSNLNGENGATGIENFSEEGKAVKFLENGILFILRDGVRYDVMGKIVSNH